MQPVEMETATWEHGGRLHLASVVYHPDTEEHTVSVQRLPAGQEDERGRAYFEVTNHNPYTAIRLAKEWVRSAIVEPTPEPVPVRYWWER